CWRGPARPAIPTPEQLAFAIIDACERLLALKFPAGLHQPLRHLDAALNAHAHGFLNLFVAGCLANQYGVGKGPWVQAVIEDEVFVHFSFDETALHYRTAPAPCAQIQIARRTAVTSFGS